MAVKITQRSTGKTWTSGTKETKQEQPKQEQVESAQSAPSGTAEEPKRQWASKSGKTVIRQVKWNDEQPVKSTNSQAGASNASADTDLSAKAAPSTKENGFFQRAWDTIKGGFNQFLSAAEDTMGTKYQAGQTARDDMNTNMASWAREQYEGEVRTLESMRAENADVPGTYSDAALANQQRIVDEAAQRAGIYEKVSGIQQEAGEAARDLAMERYVKSQQNIADASEGLGKAGQTAVHVGAGLTGIGISLAADLATGGKSTVPGVLLRMVNKYGSSTMAARASGKDLTAQQTAGAISASGAAVGAALSSGFDPIGQNVLGKMGLLQSTGAVAVKDGVRGMMYALGDTGMNELSKALTYPDNYKPDAGEIATDLFVAFAFGSASSLLRSAKVSSQNKQQMRSGLERLDAKYQTAKMQMAGMTGAERAKAAQECLDEIYRFTGDFSKMQITGADAEVRNVYAALQIMQQEMQSIASSNSGIGIGSGAADVPSAGNLPAVVGPSVSAAVAQPQTASASVSEPAAAAQAVSQSLQTNGVSAPATANDQNTATTETVAPKQNTVQTPTQGATQREAFKEVEKSSAAPKQETRETASAPKAQTETGAASMEPIAKTLGTSGQKAIFNAYDGKMDTAEYAGEFVKVYNAARAGNDLPETKTLEPWQRYAAEVAGKNDMGPQTEQESTIVNTDPAEHTKAEQAVIEAYQEAVDDSLVRFVEQAIQNKGANNSRYTLKPVSDRAAADIQKKTGVNVSGFKTVLEQRAAEHIVGRHGANGSADTSMRDMNDIGRIQYVLDNYDSLEYGGKSTAYTTVKERGKTASADTVRYSKKVNGTYYIVEAVPNTKAKTTFIVSAYMNKTGTQHPVLDPNSPDVNAQSANAAIPAPIGENGGRHLVPDQSGPNVNARSADAEAPSSTASSVAEQSGAVKQTGANTFDADGVDRLVQYAAENTVDHSAEWTATRVGDKKQKPKPLSEIIAGIEHDFGINITTGHARGRVRGQYSRLDNGIRTKITNDLPTVSHELGHALDREYGLTGELTDEMRGELEKSLGDLKSAYKENEWASEGFAEYLRKYLQNSETAAIDYPEFTKHFMNSLSQRDRALVENLADEVNAYYSLDTDTAQSAIRLREESAPTGDTTGDKLKAEASVLYQAWVDSLHGIRRLDEATGTNTYRLATNAAYSDAMAGQIITGNLTDANGQYVGPGLKAALHGINLKNKDEYRAFGEYLVARHGPERLKDGMRVFADDRKNSTAFMNRRVEELEKQYPAFHDAAERLYSFQNQLKETWLVGTGLISEETSKAWDERWKYYVPFNRAVPQGQGGAKRGFANQQNPVKRARGSGRELVHPVDNIISNVVKVVNAGVRNNVMRRITDEAQRVGADAVFLEKIPTPMHGTRVDLTGVKRDLKDQIAEKDWANAKDFEEIVADIDDYMLQFQSGKAFGDVVTVRKNGKPEFWKVNDPLLLQSITEMSPSKAGGLVDAIGKVSHFMTSNITGDNIIWSIFSNLPRDLGTLMVYAKEPNRFKLLKEIGMSYANKLKGDSADPLYLEYLAMGGGKASYYSTDRDIAKKARKDIVGGITLNPLDWMSYLGDMIEQGPRFATYKCLRDRGADPQTAFYEAMDVTTNFRRGGRTSRQVNKFIPFFNAGVQGADKHVRFLTGQDAPPEQRKRVVRNRVITYFAVSAGIATMFYLINNRDEESKKNYQQLSTYTKNSYFCIPIGDGKYFAVAKPRDLAVLTSAMESGLELGVGGNKHAFDGFWSYAASNYLPNVVSDLAQGDWKGALGGLGIIGIGTSMVANRDFLGRPIESAGMQYLEPKDRYNDRTSKLAYWAGQAFDVSPQMTDYFFNNVLGGWWKYQKAIFPVGEENRDWTLGVKNTYVKDNQYSQDLTNWLYDKADQSSQASKSDPDDISKKITAKTDSNMISFYGNYNKLSKSDTKSTAARGTRQLVLDMIREYQKAADNKSQTDAEKEVYAICEAHGDVDILPGVMNTSIKDADGTEYTMSAADYVEFQTDYLGIYWEAAAQALDGVKGGAQRYDVLKSVKETAKEQAKARALRRMGAKTTTAWGDKYSGANAYDVAYFKANADADGNGSVSQAEAEALLRKMNLTNAERADLWAATNKAWNEKNNPFR